MKFNWSPSGSSSIYSLANPTLVAKDLISSVKPVLVFSPFIDGNVAPYSVGGSIIKISSEHGKTTPTDENILQVGAEDNSHYKACLKRAINDCKEGKVAKLVVSRKQLILGQLNHEAVFKELVQTYPDCFVYCFEINEEIFLGATPEKLLSVDKNTCRSASLAGTMPIPIGLEINNWREKELNEQQIVTDYLKQAYNEVCTKVKTSDLAVKSNGPICHLFTEISGEIKPDYNYLDLLKLVHPTPAVCGFPKQEALNWINEYEGYNRNYYTGYIGLINEYSSDFYVNLRCLKSKGENTELYVGGGITKDSDVIEEFDETEQKLQVLLGPIKKIHTFVE